MEDRGGGRCLVDSSAVSQDVDCMDDVNAEVAVALTTDRCVPSAISSLLFPFIFFALSGVLLILKGVLL